MNVFFAATGLIFGLAGAGVALYWEGHVASAVKNASNTEHHGGSPAPLLINKYQLYLFVAEFLRLSNNTSPSTAQNLTPFEFYRIIFKLIKPMAATKLSVAVDHSVALSGSHGKK